MKHQTWFERNPKKTLGCVIIGIGLISYGLLSIKWIKQDNFKVSIKKVIHQYYASNVIDSNVGRFILLREHRPNEKKQDRPSRKYMNTVVPGTLERKYYPLETDANGFIKPSDQYPDPDVKIVFIGGSTTECYYMDQNNRFPGVVSRLLSEKWGKKVNTYNAGVSGNDTLHGINTLLNKVLPLKPDAVVLMENVNDLAVLRTQGTYWYDNSLKSHLQTTKTLFTRVEFPRCDATLTDQQIIDAFSKNLELFISICQIHGIQPILMTQANRVTDDPLYQQLNEVIRQKTSNLRTAVALQNGFKPVKVIDLAKLIPSSETYLYDPVHYTDAGSLLAAKIIAENLSDSSLDGA